MSLLLLVLLTLAGLLLSQVTVLLPLDSLTWLNPPWWVTWIGLLILFSWFMGE